MKEDEVSVEASFADQIRSEELVRIPWRMLFPPPLPPVWADPMYPAQIPAVTLAGRLEGKP